MKILKLTLINFVSYQQEIIDLSDVNIAAIVGDNGVGKSTIVDAITYALFGQTRAKSDDELSYSYDEKEKKWNVDKFQVKLTFELGSRIYQIIRSKSPSGTNLKFGYDEDFQLTGSVIRETEKNIQKIIGMDYDSFTSSVILKQDDYDALMEMSPAECKKVLMKIMNLDRFELKADQIKKLYDDLNLQLGVIKSKIDTISTELESTITGSNFDEIQISLKFEKKRLNEYNEVLAIIQSKHATLKAKYDQQTESRERLNDLKQKYSELQKKINDIENKFDEVLAKAGGKLKEILEGLSAIPELRDSIEKKQKILNERIKSIREERGGLNSTVSGLESTINALKANDQVCLLGKSECNLIWKKKIQQQIAEKSVLIDEIMEKKKVLADELLKEEERYKDFQPKLDKLSAAEKVGIYHGQIKEMKETISSILIEKEKMEEEVAKAKVFDDDVRALSIQIRSKKEDIETSTNEISKFEREIGRLKEREDRKKKLEEEKRELEIELRKIKKKTLVYEYLYKAFSKDGIPALIIENTVPQLENDANEMLGKLTNNRISVEFKLQKKLKGGGFSDSFEIFVSDENGTRSSRMFSGGEKLRVFFALHIAFSKYLTRRNFSKIKLFFLDEPSGLDQIGLEKLVEAISLLRDSYEQIFIISHIRELTDLFPQTMIVEKGLTGSHMVKKEIDRLDEFI